MIFRYETNSNARNSVQFSEYSFASFFQNYRAIARNEMAQVEATIARNSAQRNSDWKPYPEVINIWRSNDLRIISGQNGIRTPKNLRLHTKTNVYHIWRPTIYQARIFKQEFFNTSDLFSLIGRKLKMVWKI